MKPQRWRAEKHSDRRPQGPRVGRTAVSHGRHACGQPADAMELEADVARLPMNIILSPVAGDKRGPLDVLLGTIDAVVAAEVQST